MTPFIVKMNGNNSFTVLAVGASRASYALGNNDFPFSATPLQLTLAPGDKIAPGFMDSYPDGTGGTRNGAVSYEYYGTDVNYYSYSETNTASSITVGQAPATTGYLLPNLLRDYYFSISLGFGGKEDEDGDSLPDRWELAYASGLTGLSGTADTDADGMSDLDEHQAGTNPTDPTSRLVALGIVKDVSSLTASLKTVPGRFYRIEASANLSAWSEVGTWKAASWPATATHAIIPQASLPPDSAERAFIRVTPVTGP